MSGETPLLSIAMPTYNGAGYLPRALNPLVGLDTHLFEIVVADDGSTDETLALLEHYAQKLPLRRVPHQPNGNWVAAIQTALNEARGTYACMLHQDDGWLPGRMERLLQWIQAFPECDLFLGSARFVGPENQPLGTWRCPLPAHRFIPANRVLHKLAFQNFVPIPAPVFRRSLALRAPLDPTLWYFADWDAWIRWTDLADGCIYDPSPTVFFRVHPTSQTAIRTRDTDDVRLQFRQVADHLTRLPRWSEAARHALQHDMTMAEMFYQGLLDAAHPGQRPDGFALLRAALRAGPFRVLRYLHAARLFERAWPRWRLRHLRVQNHAPKPTT